MAEKTYTMKATCHNCHETFDVEIVRGHQTFGHTTECPYCGIEGGTSEFSYKKPERY